MTAAQSKQEVNRYIAPLVNEVVVVVPEEGTVINGPYGDEVEFCDSKSNYFCVEHPGFLACNTKRYPNITNRRWLGTFRLRV